MTQGEKDRAREMTYQVGWKRGKIKLPANEPHNERAADTGTDEAAPSHALASPATLTSPEAPIAPPAADDAKAGSRLLTRLWQPLPALPLKALVILLVLLPVAGFALILVLAGMLARVKN